MRKTRIEVDLSLCDLNTGQLDWLPKNPRQWNRDALDRTVESLQEDPDWLEDRPLNIVPYEAGDSLRYVVFCGNLRTSACWELKRQTAPAYCYEPETEEDRETVRRRAIKDNGTFGWWDADILANEWGEAEQLLQWGVPDFVMGGAGTGEDGKGGASSGGGMKETERLSELKYDPLYYEPQAKPTLKLEECIDDTKFKAKVAALDEYKLTEKQKAILTMFAYRFLKIDFEAVANYYAYNATREEQKAIERLRLVLVDDGSIAGFIEDGLLRVAQIATDAAIEQAEEKE